jgi:hypothetical protein
VGIFVIPALYVAFQTLRERVKNLRNRDSAEPHS